MKTISIKLLLLLAVSLSGQSFAEEGKIVPKIFSSQTTFPFSPGSTRVPGVGRNTIYITVDDGPTWQATPKILDTLSRYGANATFFVHGFQAQGKTSLLARMNREGHLVGNHSQQHILDYPTANAFIDVLMETHNIIAPYVSRDQILVYRSPGGVWNNWRSSVGNQHRTLRKYVGPIYWNVGGGSSNNVYDDADWKCWSQGGRRRGVTPDQCARSYYNQIISNYNNGRASIVLMHDIKVQSADMLESLLRMLSRTNVRWNYETVDKIPAVEEMAFYNSYN